MIGNVWEWTQDGYGVYPTTSEVNPIGASNALENVLRGGSWTNTPSLSRSAARSFYEPTFRGINFGFRHEQGQNLCGPVFGETS